MLLSGSGSKRERGYAVHVARCYDTFECKEVRLVIHRRRSILFFFAIRFEEFLHF